MSVNAGRGAARPTLGFEVEVADAGTTGPLIDRWQDELIQRT